VKNRKKARVYRAVVNVKFKNSCFHKHERDTVFGDDFEHSAAVFEDSFTPLSAAFRAFFEAVRAFEAACAHKKRGIEA
jgi:hypothetical protein